MTVVSRKAMVTANAPDTLGSGVNNSHVALQVHRFAASSRTQSTGTVLTRLPLIRRIVVGSTRKGSLGLMISHRPGTLAAIRRTLTRTKLPVFNVSRSHPDLSSICLTTAKHALVSTRLTTIKRHSLGGRGGRTVGKN